MWIKICSLFHSWFSFVEQYLRKSYCNLFIYKITVFFQQGQTIRQLINARHIRRVAMCCLATASGNLAISLYCFCPGYFFCQTLFCPDNKSQHVMINPKVNSSPVETLTVYYYILVVISFVITFKTKKCVPKFCFAAVQVTWFQLRFSLQLDQKQFSIAIFKWIWLRLKNGKTFKGMDPDISLFPGRRQHLAVSHEKTKVTLLQLSALLKQANVSKRKLTLTRLSTTAMPFSVTTITGECLSAFELPVKFSIFTKLDKKWYVV